METREISTPLDIPSVKKHEISRILTRALTPSFKHSYRLRNDTKKATRGEDSKSDDAKCQRDYGDTLDGSRGQRIKHVQYHAYHQVVDRTKMTNDILKLIGNTPLIRLRNLEPKHGIQLYAKLESQNPSGSVKDRIVTAMIENAEHRGLLSPGQTIVEASTGNTAISLAFVGARKGYGVQIVLPRGVVPSIADILHLYGANIEWCESTGGMRGAIDRARELSEANGFQELGQFSNLINVETHYQTTGGEIVKSMDAINVFVAGIGTGGTIMGVGRRLREHYPEVQIIGVEPRLGDRLQGLRSLADGYIPPLLDLTQLDGRHLVDSADAIRRARSVIQHEGLLVGVSSGAVLHAALRVAEGMHSGNIVMMFSDGGWKYLPARPWDAADAGEENLDEVHWW